MPKTGKRAKPVSRDSNLSHMFKYQRIESYEDALNNIEFTERENSLFEEHAVELPAREVKPAKVQLS